MHASISAFPSAVFYDRQLCTPLSLARDEKLGGLVNKYFTLANHSVEVRFINVGGCKNEIRGQSSVTQTNKENTSYSNKAEAKQIINSLKTIIRGEKDHWQFNQGSIGIITPYSAQVSLIKSIMLSDIDYQEIARASRYHVEVNSIDAYQGKERDLIIFSTVRSNKYGNVGFLADWRRMNVAITRAKSGLIIFGDLETLKRGDKHWDAFLEWCDGYGCIINAN